MTREVKHWVCGSTKCDYQTTTYVALTAPPTHTHPTTKRTYIMKEKKS